MLSKIVPFIAGLLLLLVIVEGTRAHQLANQFDYANEELSDVREKLADVREKLVQLESRADDIQTSIESIRERRSNENIDDTETDADNLKSDIEDTENDADEDN